MDGVEVEADQHATGTRKAAGDQRDEGGGAAGVDAHQGCRFWPLGHGAQGEAEACAAHQGEQGGHQGCNGGKDQELGGGDADSAQLDGLGWNEARREASDIGAEPGGHAGIKREDAAKRDHQRGELGGAGAAQSGEQGGIDDHRQRAGAECGQGEGGPDGQAEAAGEEEGEEGAGGEIEAIGEVDDAQHAEHQREAEGEQGVGGAEKNAVDELLGEHRGLGTIREWREAGRTV